MVSVKRAKPSLAGVLVELVVPLCWEWLHSGGLLAGRNIAVKLTWKAIVLNQITVASAPILKQHMLMSLIMTTIPQPTSIRAHLIRVLTKWSKLVTNKKLSSWCLLNCRHTFIRIVIAASLLLLTWFQLTLPYTFFFQTLHWQDATTIEKIWIAEWSSQFL